jgi:hypothetical protein
MRKTSLLPNIRDDAINALIGLTQGPMSYSNYTQQFNDFFAEVSIASYEPLLVRSFHQWNGEASASDPSQVSSLSTKWLQMWSYQQIS